MRRWYELYLAGVDCHIIVCPNRKMGRELSIYSKMLLIKSLFFHCWICSSGTVHDRTGQQHTLTSVWDRMKIMQYNLEVVEERARQRNEDRTFMYQQALSVALNVDPSKVAYVDETRKDVRALIRARARGRIGRKVILHERFNRSVRYTMIGAADINGLTPIACAVIE